MWLFFLCCSCPRPSCWLYASFDHSQNLFSCLFSANLQVEATIEYICRHEKDGAILVFLTGWDEISKLLEKIKGNNFLGNSSKFLVLPLHGSMPTVNQREIFDRPPNNIRQVSLATFVEVKLTFLFIYLLLFFYIVCL